MSQRADRKHSQNVEKNEFGNFIRNGASESQVMSSLRDKYHDSRKAEEMLDHYKKRMEVVTRKANKFKELIFSKYSSLSLTQLIEKAKKFKAKYEFDDDEFYAFINMAINDKKYASNIYNKPNTPMGKLLGQGSEFDTGRMNVQVNEMDVLQNILTTYNAHLLLHEQVKMQCFAYSDCALQAITGKYSQNNTNAYSCIHPVLAALFIPKIKYIDEHMILANLGGIVNHRYNGIPIRTAPDYEVYWDLKTDPNEFVCASPNDSPLVDLQNRVNIQIELWKQVRELREGRYYSTSLLNVTNFEQSLYMCKNNLFSDAETALVVDECTMLKKLFGVFSMRPTYVNIQSVNNNIMSGNYNLSTMAVSSAAQISTMPVVNIRLPLEVTGGNTGIETTIPDALSQINLFVDKNTTNAIVPKQTKIVFSRDMIVFYANRRFRALDYQRLNMPIHINALPVTHGQLETVNESIIRYDETISVGGEAFSLKSVVLLEKAMSNTKLIVGCSAGIVNKTNQVNVSNKIPEKLYYNPMAASIAMPKADGTYVRNDPITAFSPSGDDSFESKFSRLGTVYIYLKDSVVQSHF